MFIKSKHAAAIAWALATPMCIAQSSPLPVSAARAARAAAIRECNVKAQQFRTTPVWGNYELHIYRTCMAEHHQAWE
jgi:hypothetical protein